MGTIAQEKNKEIDVIESYLQRLQKSTFDGILFEVLPRLGDISIEDAERWATNYDHLDLKEDIKNYYGSRQAVQMEDLTEELSRLLIKKCSNINQAIL